MGRLSIYEREALPCAESLLSSAPLRTLRCWTLAGPTTFAIPATVVKKGPALGRAGPKQRERTGPRRLVGVHTEERVDQRGEHGHEQGGSTAARRLTIASNGVVRGCLRITSL